MPRFGSSSFVLHSVSSTFSYLLGQILHGLAIAAAGTPLLYIFGSLPIFRTTYLAGA
ncbi:MAG: hypothetical protein MJZ82_02980 [Paludibacteraceae bacterium]|nr:hypothetical protein [Paludibacteraceae bacterium]